MTARREILVFASRDASGAEAARTLAATFGAQFIDRLSNRLDDLILVAEYQVVEPVVIVVLVDGRLVLRIPRLITHAELARDLESWA